MATSGNISAGGTISSSGLISSSTGLSATGTGTISTSNGSISAAGGSGTISASQTITAGQGLIASAGGVGFTGKLQSNVVSAAANANINPANGSVFIYLDAANTLNPALFGGGGAGTEGTIIWVFAPTVAQTANGCGINANEVGCFVYVSGAWRVVAQD